MKICYAHPHDTKSLKPGERTERGNLVGSNYLEKKRVDPAFSNGDLLRLSLLCDLHGK